MKYRIILYLLLLGIAAVGYLNDPVVTNVLSQALRWLIATLLIVLSFALCRLDSKLGKPFIHFFKMKFIEVMLHIMLIFFVFSEFAKSSPVLFISIILCFYGIIMPTFYKDTNCLQPESTESENLFLFRLRLVIYNLVSAAIIFILIAIASSIALLSGRTVIAGIIMVIWLIIPIFYKYLEKPNSKKLFLFSFRSVVYNFISTLGSGIKEML